MLIGGAEEVVAKLVVEHDEMLACQMFAREQFAAISSMAPGTSVAFGVQVQPCMNLISFLVAREDVVARMDVGNGFQPFVQPPVCTDENPAHVSSPRLPGRDASLPNIVAEKLVAGSNPTIAELAYVRSGEKGEMINIGVIARSPEFLPILRSALSPKALRDHLSDLGNFEVTIYELPGIQALNIVLAGALPGGLNASQRLDPAAKSIGQRLTSLRVPL